MAASNTNSTGRKNYYSVSYGKLSTKVKEVPDNFTEITEAELKSKTQAVEQIDLRNKYVNKGKGDYPYAVFYDSLVGHITEQEKVENDNGVSLNLTVVDEDGDTSILQMKFYSKYTENILNRLLNTKTDNKFNFFPYAIPNTAEFDGSTKSFYTQGVSLKVNGEKILPKYDKDSKVLPATEQVKVQGKMTTSRDARLDFLYAEFAKNFIPANVQNDTKSEIPKAIPKEGFEPIGKDNEPDDLPF